MSIPDGVTTAAGLVLVVDPLPPVAPVAVRWCNRQRCHPGSDDERITGDSSIKGHYLSPTSGKASVSFSRWSHNETRVTSRLGDAKGWAQSDDGR
jgi:hypothetical protein